MRDIESSPIRRGMIVLVCPYNQALYSLTADNHYPILFCPWCFRSPARNSLLGSPSERGHVASQAKKSKAQWIDCFFSHLSPYQLNYQAFCFAWRTGFRLTRLPRSIYLLSFVVDSGEWQINTWFEFPAHSRDILCTYQQIPSELDGTPSFRTTTIFPTVANLCCVCVSSLFLLPDGVMASLGAELIAGNDTRGIGPFLRHCVSCLPISARTRISVTCVGSSIRPSLDQDPLQRDRHINRDICLTFQLNSGSSTLAMIFWSLYQHLSDCPIPMDLSRANPETWITIPNTRLSKTTQHRSHTPHPLFLILITLHYILTRHSQVKSSQCCILYDLQPTTMSKTS